MKGSLAHCALLRPVRPEDLSFLAEVYASTRREELALTDWTIEQKRTFCQMQFEAQHRHYQQYYADARFDIIECSGKPVGRLYVARWEKEIRIIDITILPQSRGLGIGSKFILRLQQEARAAGKTLSIHVEKINPALRLYHRLGFKPIEDKGVCLLMAF